MGLPPEEKEIALIPLKKQSILNYDSEIVLDCRFKWHEYAILREWNAYAIPTEQQRAAAINLFTRIRDYIRGPIGKPLTINSGARTSEYVAYLRRQGIKAATKGAHLEWAGVDLRAPDGMSNAEFWKFCHAVWPGRMENLSATPHHVHLDTRQWGNRVRFNP